MTVYLGPQWELMLELLGVVGTQTMACPPPLSSVATGSRHQGSLFIAFLPILRRTSRDKALAKENGSV